MKYHSVRDQLLPAGDREDNIACDLNDMTWLEQIDASEGVVLFAAGGILLLLD